MGCRMVTEQIKELAATLKDLKVKSIQAGDLRIEMHESAFEVVDTSPPKVEGMLANEPTEDELQFWSVPQMDAATSDKEEG